MTETLVGVAGRPLYLDGHGQHDHCGCCGSCATWLASSFCLRCRGRKGHLGHPNLQPWDRTYEATHGEPCPFAKDSTDE